MTRKQRKFAEEHLYLLSQQIEQALSDVAHQYGCTLDEAAAAVNTISDYLRSAGRDASYMDVVNTIRAQEVYNSYQQMTHSQQLHNSYQTALTKESFEAAARPVMSVEAEKPNQKNDLEIFDIKVKEKPVYIFKNGTGIFTAENSQWDKELLAKTFECKFDDMFVITYDDDWIKEALEEK